MSVINQVLKDLAQRKEEVVNTAATAEDLSKLGLQDKIMTNAPLWKRKVFWKITIAVLMLVGSSVEAVLLWKSHQKAQAEVQAQLLNMKKNIQPSPIVTPPATPVPAPKVEAIPEQPKQLDPPKPDPHVEAPVRVMTPEQILEKEYRDILDQIETGKLLKAQEALEKFTLAHPDFEPALYTLISIDLDSARYDIAAKLIADAKGRIGDTPELRMYQAQLLFDQGQDGKALDLLIERLPDIKTQTQYYTLLAGLYLKIGEYQSSERYYQQLLAVDSSRSLWWFGLAESYYGQKRYQDAKNAYQEALNYNNCPPGVRIYIFDQLKLLE